MIHQPSRRRKLMSYRRHDEPRPGPWQVRLDIRDLQPSKRPPPPMTVPVERTRKFRCVFDLQRCRRVVVPSSVSYSFCADSRRPSGLLDDIDLQRPEQSVTDNGPLITVKHFCKVSLISSHMSSYNLYKQRRGSVRTVFLPAE